MTAQAKEDAILAQVAATHATGRPVLIGTHDVAESERLAARLTRNGLGLQVLNAKNDAAEAAIVAEAGRPVEVDVSQLIALTHGGEVRKHPDAQRLAAGHRDLGGAQERHVAQTDHPRCGGGKGRREVGGHGEDDADQVVVIDVVAAEHLFEQLDGASLDVGRGVGFDGGGAA